MAQFISYLFGGGYAVAEQEDAKHTAHKILANGALLENKQAMK